MGPRTVRVGGVPRQGTVRVGGVPCQGKEEPQCAGREGCLAELSRGA